MVTPRRSLKHTAIKQMKEFLLIALYLWLVFALLVIFKSMILSEHHTSFTYHGFALINALALGKVMLVAKDLHLDANNSMTRRSFIRPF
jgi:hypothetical protein